VAVAYAPRGVGLIGGLTAVLTTPNKVVGVALVVGGVVVDAVTTFWTRRMERRSQQNGN
jgi:hypothetical protein